MKTLKLKCSSAQLSKPSIFVNMILLDNAFGSLLLLYATHMNSIYEVIASSTPCSLFVPLQLEPPCRILVIPQGLHDLLARPCLNHDILIGLAHKT